MPLSQLHFREMMERGCLANLKSLCLLVKDVGKWAVELRAQLCLTLCNPMDCSLPGSSTWDFLGKKTGVGGHFLLWGIFLLQGLNLCLLPWQMGSLLDWKDSSSPGPTGRGTAHLWTVGEGSFCCQTFQTSLYCHPWDVSPESGDECKGCRDTAPLKFRQRVLPCTGRLRWGRCSGRIHTPSHHSSAAVFGKRSMAAFRLRQIV